MAGLINKINRSLISPLPIIYSSTLKQIIKTMLRKSPEHRPTAAELLRHPHLQPFLLRCHNPSTVFLPVKSPSPNKTKEKIKKPSPSSSSGARKDFKEREVKPKQRELLPLFDENNDMQYPTLMDGDDSFIEDKLETKRVDPTSYSGKISHDSEDSKSGVTSCETTTACAGDDLDNFDSSSIKESITVIDDLTISNTELSGEQEESKLEELDSEKENITGAEVPCSPPEPENAEKKTEDTSLDKCSNVIGPDTISIDKVVPLVEENLREEPRSSSSVVEDGGHLSGAADNAETHMDNTVEIKADEPTNPRLTEKEVVQLINEALTDESKGEWENPGLHRADALESLLELCARLLKQDKFDELSGVLKPFGEDTVSSRETAIWLTKSLMNAEKLDEDS